MSNKKNLLDQNKDEIKAWWNSKDIKKWATKVYDPNSPSYHHLEERRVRTLNFFNSISQNQKLNVFEYGFGGAVLAKDILNQGHKYTGVDISEFLVKNAKKNNQKFIQKKKAKFFQGSLDDIQTVQAKSVDVVIICGAIQYSSDYHKTFTEIKRILKKNGYFILSQGNMFCLNEMLNYRYFLKSLIWYITDEHFQYSYSLSFKDIIFETKLSKYFKKYENKKFMKSKFMNSESNIWKYKIHKRLLSYGRCKKLLEDYSFKILKTYSGPFLLYAPTKKDFLKKVSDEFLKFLCLLKIPLIKKFADNQLFLAKNNIID